MLKPPLFAPFLKLEGENRNLEDQSLFQIIQFFQTVRRHLATRTRIMPLSCIILANNNDILNQNSEEKKQKTKTNI